MGGGRSSSAQPAIRYERVKSATCTLRILAKRVQFQYRVSVLGPRPKATRGALETRELGHVCSRRYAAALLTSQTSYCPAFVSSAR